MRFLPRSFAVSALEASLRASTPDGRKWHRTPGRLRISRTSLLVNEACAGPRRPTMCTVSIWERRRASTAYSGMSVEASWPGSCSSTCSRNVMEGRSCNATHKQTEREREYPRDVERDVALSDHYSLARGGKLELSAPHRRVAVVPRHELA